MKYPNLEHTSKVFCDTSFFFATFDMNDSNHKIALDINKFCANRGIDFYTTWEIIGETITLLRTRHSYRKAIYFIDEVFPNIELILLTNEERQKALRLFKKLSKDKELSLCDVISYFVVTEKLGEKTPCLSFDEDFKNLGLLVIC